MCLVMVSRNWRGCCDGPFAVTIVITAAGGPPPALRQCFLLARSIAISTRVDRSQIEKCSKARLGFVPITTCVKSLFDEVL
jgi:hypothetical protein